MMANGTTSTTTESSPSNDYTRLHITPLDSELLKVVIPSAVLPKARNISYHTIETFPERRYGFVDLPKMEADKLKMKLNGATLKGVKVKIEEARPEAIPQPATDDDSGRVKKPKKSMEKGEKFKKRKRGSNVVEGVELEDRKVKRGWTVTETDMINEKKKAKKENEKGNKDKQDKKEKKDKKKTKSKYTNGPECLFKQKLPAVPEAANTDDADDGHKRKKRRKDREVVIHEFDKTVKHPSFLKSTVEPSKSGELVFEDGKGWVDGDGNVVEPVKSRRPKPSTRSAPPKQKSPEPASIQEDDDTTSSDSSSSSEGEDESSNEEMEESEAATPKPKLKTDTNVTNTPISALKTELARPRSSGSTTSLTIKIPPVTPGSSKIHPLEALYKRFKGDETTPNGGAAESKPFSFFDIEDIEEEEDHPTERRPSQVPMTPFTKQDFEFRNIRSAAPTPDTAHANRAFNIWPIPGSSEPAVPEEDEEAEDGEDGDGMQREESAAKKAVKPEADATGSKPQASEEQKWFWDNRGDLNRAWKKRRRTTGKEKRNRANRARSARSG